MGITDGRQMMSLAAARTAWQTGKPAGAIERWTPALTATGYPALLGSIGAVDVRITNVAGRFVIGQHGESIGRPAGLVWFFVASGRTLADAHAAAWRILQPMRPEDGVLAQAAAALAAERAAKGGR